MSRGRGARTPRCGGTSARSLRHVPVFIAGLVHGGRRHQWQRLPRRLLAVLMIAPLAACASLPWVELQGQRYGVEIADDDAERTRGLMFRSQLAPGRGMLFVQAVEGPLAIWMKDTRMPLDILYFDSDRRLVSQQRNVPPCTLGVRCPLYPSARPARYILEINAGEAERLGLQDGAVLTFSTGISD